MKRFFLSILFAGLLLFLASCISKNQKVASIPTNITNFPASASNIAESYMVNEATESTMTSEHISEHINEAVSDNIQIDADVIYPIASDILIGSSFVQEISIDTIKSFLLRNQTIENEEVSENGAGNFLTTEGSVLSYNTNAAYYMTAFGADYVDKLINWTSYKEYGELDITTETKSHEFASISQIEKQFVDDMQSIGFYQDLKVKVYSMTSQDFQSVEMEFKEKGYYDVEIKDGTMKYKENWNDEDDCYIITAEFMPQKNVGIVNQEVRLSEFAGYSASYIWAVYSKKGIEILQIMHPRTWDFSNAEYIQIVSFDEAKQNIIDKYESIITNNNIVINTIKLTYIVKEDENYDLILYPVWLYDISEKYVAQQGEISKGDNASENRYTLLFDAVTGKEII